MAIKSVRTNDKLTLEFDNGDIAKTDEVMQKWGFKDHQSFLRFVTSILLLNENKHFSIKIDGIQKDIVPAADYLRKV